MILDEAHDGVTGGHYIGKLTTQKILRVRLWWPSLHKDAKDYCIYCDVFQRIGKQSWRDEIPLAPQVTLQAFNKWDVDLGVPINPPTKRLGAQYIITAVDYLTRRVEAELVKHCITMKFLFQNVVTRFGCPWILLSDQGNHIVNKMIEALTQELQIYHRKSTPYHLQANGIVEAFNNTLDHSLIKVCNVNCDD